MKSALITIIVLIVLAGAGYAGWYYFIKKSPEGGRCTSASRCEAGLKCISNTCSSGKAGSACSAKTDCTTGYCVNSLCTEGEKGDACATYRDCTKGLFCKSSVCSEPPSYSQYFDKISVSKIKPGMPPGPNNMPQVTTEFKANVDAVEIDFTGVKATTKGEFYVEIVDATSGELLISSDKQQLDGHDTGTGMGLPTAQSGEYDLNVYYNSELVYTTPIKITN